MTSCTNQKYKKVMDKDIRYAKARYNLPSNEEAIQKDIFTHGPITAAFEVKDDFFNYKSGVYEPGPNSKSVGGHAIKLIGWGVEKDVPYWLVMNSWNEYWGDHGLVKMRRNSPRIRLERECFAAEADPTRKYEIEEKEDDNVEFDVSAEEEEVEDEDEEDEEEEKES